MEDGKIKMVESWVEVSEVELGKVTNLGYFK